MFNFFSSLRSTLRCFPKTRKNLNKTELRKEYRKIHEKLRFDLQVTFLTFVILFNVVLLELKFFCESFFIFLADDSKRVC